MNKNKFKITALFIVLTILTMGMAQLDAAPIQKEVPVKIFAAAYKHIPGLKNNDMSLIAKLRKEFNLYYTDAKDMRYHRVAMDVKDQNGDLVPDSLVVYLLPKDMYGAEVFKVKLGKNQEFVDIKSNYEPTAEESSELETDRTVCNCPDPNIEVLLSTCETGIPTAVEAINTSFNYALAAGYTAVKLLGSEENSAAINDWLCCPNLKYWGRVGHGLTTGILLADGTLSYTYFNSLDANALAGKVLYFNSCEVFNDPLKSSILGRGADKFSGGICNLYIGSSEIVFKCWNSNNFNQVSAPATDEMCYWVYECESSTGYPQLGCHGCGGPVNVFPEPAGIFPPTATITVIDPNGGESWLKETTQNILWSSTGTINNVALYYSLDGGSSWTTITASTPNDGVFAWTLPYVSRHMRSCKVKVADVDSSASDTSDGVFTIRKR